MFNSLRTAILSLAQAINRLSEGFETGDVSSRLATLKDIQQMEGRIMATLNELLEEVKAERTVVDSVLTLVEGLKVRLDEEVGNELSAEGQAKVDAIFAEVSANRAKLGSAITANTPTPAPEA